MVKKCALLSRHFSKYIMIVNYGQSFRTKPFYKKPKIVDLFRNIGATYILRHDKNVLSFGVRHKTQLLCLAFTETCIRNNIV